MRYSDTGNFTNEQLRLAKNIARNIKKLRESGCSIFGKQQSLVAFLSKDEKHSHLANNTSADYDYPIPYLDCGDIDDSGADDAEYFETGYITEP